MDCRGRRDAGSVFRIAYCVKRTEYGVRNTHRTYSANVGLTILPQPTITS